MPVVRFFFFILWLRLPACSFVCTSSSAWLLVFFGRGNAPPRLGEPPAWKRVKSGGTPKKARAEAKWTVVVGAGARLTRARCRLLPRAGACPCARGSPFVPSYVSACFCLFLPVGIASSVSVCLFVCLSGCLFVCLSACLSACVLCLVITGRYLESVGTCFLCV